MPALMITIQNGTWVAALANVDGWFKPFRGATLAEQADWVQAFARQMEADDAMQAIGALELDAAGWEATAQQLFATDELIYLGESVYTAEVGETLLETLGAAGEALLEAILA